VKRKKYKEGFSQLNILSEHTWNQKATIGAAAIGAASSCSLKGAAATGGAATEAVPRCRWEKQ
jgi:hypothetical protein